MDKNNLQKLSDFVIELSHLKENEWFRKELLFKLKLVDGTTNIKEDYENTLLDDLKRSKYYLKSIDKTIWKEALKYYSSIKYSDLKIELIHDYKEMKIADKSDDIIEYTRRIVMQLENCLNAICLIINAHDLISTTPEKYRNNTTDLLKGEFSFFNKDGSKKLLSKISIQSKVFFAKQYYEIRYSYNDMSQMITIRNKSSHRGEYSDREKEIMDFAKSNISERKASYFICYDIFWNKMTNLKN